MAEPKMKKAFLESLPVACEEQLREWVEITLQNEDVEVGPSRQEAFEREKLEVLAARYSVSVTDVREFKL